MVFTDFLPTFTSKLQIILMAELQHFTLTQLGELIASNDEHTVGNYITQNLAVARNISIQLIQHQFHREPTILPEMRLMLIKQGWASVTLNMIDHRLKAGDLIFLGTNGIIHCHQASTDVQGIGFSLSDDLFQLAIGNRIPQAFDGHLRDFVLHLDQDEAQYYDSLHQLLAQHIMGSRHSSQVTLHLVSALLWLTNHMWSRHEQSHRESQSREQRLFTDFIQLVTQYAPVHHTIDFYASRLCLTPRYLSAIIRQVSGKSAKQWIDNALVTRIKIDLKHSDKPIALIADDMNFPNPSFMTKFFKRMTGMTPTQFQDNQSAI